jgi:formate dehydrogenase subunit delta
MANQIARFFESQGDHASAVAGVAGHIRDFWSPSMRRDAIAQIDQGAAVGLSDIARDAILSLR